jgi:hypothetical protein
MTKRRHLALELTGALFSLLAIWLLIAYLFLPAFWHVHFSKHSAVTNGPRITGTSSGNPGDPVSVALIASESDLVAAMLAAGRYPADPITLERAGRISSIDWQVGFQNPPEGRNGEGDHWKTDGRLAVITLAPQSPTQASPTPQ